LLAIDTGEKVAVIAYAGAAKPRVAELVSLAFQGALDSGRA
jgi:hypothetical protein